MTGVVIPPDETSAADDTKNSMELELRRREIRYSGISTFLQMLVAVAALVAAGIAVKAANGAERAIDVAADGVAVASDGVELQAAETRLSTAVLATGGDQPAERAAGFRLLEHLVASEINAANGDAVEGAEALGLYGAAVDVLEVYLRNGPSAPPDSDEAGRGYGHPAVPIDNIYAAGAMRSLMKLETEVLGLARDDRPTIDLARVQLHGIPWRGIDFAWLGGFDFREIDLRRANLTDATFGEMRDGEPTGVTLNGAFLQCANLENADLIGVKLVGADLRGAALIRADFTSADLSGADLTGADLTGAVFTDATWDHETIGPDGATVADGVGLAPAPPPSGVDSGANGACVDEYPARPNT